MPPGTYSHVEDLHEMLSHLGVERAHLLGASLGGQMATSFTVQHPERVSALITVGSGVGGRPMAEEAARQSDAIDEVWESGRTEEAIELEIRMWVDGPRRSAEQVDPAVREEIRRMMRENLASEGEGQPAQYAGKPTIERLAEISVPALVVVGAEDVNDKLVVADLLAQRIRGARKAVIAGAAHVPNMEQPGEFNRLVLEFLGSVNRPEA
jgi:pimeloyl-ACP methyl ester carboxylesterase